MMKQTKGRNSIVSFVALVIILYFIGLPLLIAILSSYFGSVGDVMTTAVDLIPFGDVWYWVAVQIFNGLGGQAITYSSFNGNLTILYILQESEKTLFTTIIFEAMNLLLFTFLGLTEARGIWNKAKRVLITVMSALMAACFAPMLIEFIFNQMQGMSQLASNLLTSFMTFILVGGGVAFFAALKGVTIVIALCYVGVKVILLGAAQLVSSYVCFLLILLAIQNGIPVFVVEGFILLLMFAVCLSGINLMLESVLK